MRITITGTGEYPHPEAFNKRPVFESTTPAEAVAAAIEAHMKAYGFKDVLIEVRPSCHIKLRPACTGVPNADGMPQCGNVACMCHGLD